MSLTTCVPARVMLPRESGRSAILTSMNARSEYFTLVEQRPDDFANPPDAAFRILLEDTQIREAERQTRERLSSAGQPADWATVGVVFRDQYVTIVRDAVRYPDGSLGTYIRMWESRPELRGVVMMPIWQQNVLLIRHFRHATRSWHLEIPRGFGSGEDVQSSARRELEEEIDGKVTRLVELGDVYPDTGVRADVVALFLAEVESYGAAESQEGIIDILPTPLPEFERMIASGGVSDGFLLAAYARAKARRLL